VRSNYRNLMQRKPSRKLQRRSRIDHAGLATARPELAEFLS
jgi:hypothetical protein